jgi:hypothetical protein
MSLLPLHGHKIVKISLKERRFPRIIEIYGGLIKTLENNPAEADPTHISKIKRQSYNLFASILRLEDVMGCHHNM